MRLSKHLTLAELTRSESAKRRGIDNQPTSEHLNNLKVLAEKVFEPIREHFNTPIYISSGYRSKALNEAVGGSRTSQHSQGEAIDIDMDGSASGVNNKQIFDFIKNNLKFDQLIWEFGDDKKPDWVHVSYNSVKNRGQILRATKSGGKTTYKPF